MAGPTTESLDVDFKELRADFHRTEVNVGTSIANLERSVNASITRVEIGQAKQEAVLGVFRAIVLGSLGAAITGILATVWSAGATSSKMDSNQAQVARLENRLERIESSINRLVSPSEMSKTGTAGK